MAFEGSREKIGILSELWAFMRVRKKWWLGPIVIMLALLGLLVVFTRARPSPRSSTPCSRSFP